MMGVILLTIEFDQLSVSPFPPPYTPGHCTMIMGEPYTSITYLEEELF